MSLLSLPRWVGLALLGVACAFACRGPRPDNSIALTADALRASHPDGGAPENIPSTLGGGDLIEVRVYQEADLSGIYRVSPEGTVDYPLCGKVKLMAMSASTAADVLTACLATKYIKKPQVSVLIREQNSKKVFVFGEVNKPGTFPFDQDMSIIQAITLAGGFTKIASKNNTNVTRLVDGHELKIRVPVEDIGVGRDKNFLLQPGDIVFVPESFF